METVGNIFSWQSMMLALTFLLTVGGVLLASHWLFAIGNPIRRRLAEIADIDGMASHATHAEGGFRVHWVEPLAKVLMPAEGWKLSQLRTQLVCAGLRQQRVLALYLAAKVFFAMTLPVLVVLPLLLLGVLAKTPLMGVALAALCAAIGYFSPNVWLHKRIQSRQLSITESFPDALDMLVVCVEAGLSLDAAIQRVGKEVADSHSELAEELQLVSLELRAGRGRSEALRGLADRTGVADISALTSILIQAEHFGTSIAASLREQAVDMRLIRIQRARERAAKLPVKLIFPIMVFIFPALFSIILGPAAIRIYTAFIAPGSN
jgi:tight adherence protein C